EHELSQATAPQIRVGILHQLTPESKSRGKTAFIRSVLESVHKPGLESVFTDDFGHIVEQRICFSRSIHVDPGSRPECDITATGSSYAPVRDREKRIGGNLVGL